MGMDKRVKNPVQVIEQLTQYYQDAPLWLPPHSSHRIYRVESLNPDGTTNFVRIRDRITSKEKLRKHLLEHTPVNVYFSVSSWLNPTKTSYKTYKADHDGREHLDKNGFMYSDMVVDNDHDDRGKVEDLYYYLNFDHGIPEKDMYIVWSGSGWHINIEDWFRARNTANPIEREKQCYRAMQRFIQQLIDAGFTDFDYRPQARENEDGTKTTVYNSPSGDTRRVRKLPLTVTQYGNLAQQVNPNSDTLWTDDLYDFTPRDVVDIEWVKTRRNFSNELERLRNATE